MKTRKVKIYLFNWHGATFVTRQKTLKSFPAARATHEMKAEQVDGPIRVQVSNELTPGDVLCSVLGRHYRIISVTFLPLPEGYFQAQLAAAGDASATTNTLSA